jgi:hypothetical protein
MNRMCILVCIFVSFIVVCITFFATWDNSVKYQIIHTRDKFNKIPTIYHHPNKPKISSIPKKPKRRPVAIKERKNHCGIPYHKITGTNTAVIIIFGGIGQYVSKRNEMIQFLGAVQSLRDPSHGNWKGPILVITDVPNYVKLNLQKNHDIMGVCSGDELCGVSVHFEPYESHGLSYKWSKRRVIDIVDRENVARIDNNNPIIDYFIYRDADMWTMRPVQRFIDYFNVHYNGEDIAIWSQNEKAAHRNREFLHGGMWLGHRVLSKRWLDTWHNTMMNENLRTNNGLNRDQVSLSLVPQMHKDTEQCKMKLHIVPFNFLYPLDWFSSAWKDGIFMHLTGHHRDATGRAEYQRMHRELRLSRLQFVSYDKQDDASRYVEKKHHGLNHKGLPVDFIIPFLPTDSPRVINQMIRGMNSIYKPRWILLVAPHITHCAPWVGMDQNVYCLYNTVSSGYGSRYVSKQSDIDIVKRYTIDPLVHMRDLMIMVVNDYPILSMHKVVWKVGIVPLSIRLRWFSGDTMNVYATNDTLDQQKQIHKTLWKQDINNLIFSNDAYSIERKTMEHMKIDVFGKDRNIVPHLPKLLKHITSDFSLANHYTHYHQALHPKDMRVVENDLKPFKTSPGSILPKRKIQELTRSGYTHIQYQEEKSNMNIDTYLQALKTDRGYYTKLMKVCIQKGNKKMVAEFGGWCWGKLEEFRENYAISIDLSEYIVKHHFKPGDTIADLGGGNGAYVSYFIDHGMSSKSQCYDGAIGIEEMSRYTRYVNVTWANLARYHPVSHFMPTFDWTVSFEVGEHIPKKSEQNFLDTLTTHARKGIILSWGHPGQGGHGHINNQPRAYIIKEIEKRGFIYNDESSRAVMQLPYDAKNGNKGRINVGCCGYVWNKKGHLWHFRRNVMIFHHK